MSRIRLEHPDSKTAGHLITADVLAGRDRKHDDEEEEEEEEGEEEEGEEDGEEGYSE